MIFHSDPERPALLDMAKLRLDQCWRRKEIGDTTYVRSLFCLDGRRYTADVATSELNLLKMERRQ